VRKYVGYERYDCIEAVEAMNELYEVLRLYLNLFQPTFKLQGKAKRVKTADGKQAAKPYQRIYDQPQTLMIVNEYILSAEPRTFTIMADISHKDIIHRILRGYIKRNYIILFRS
jgi:hypothetical protein